MTAYISVKNFEKFQHYKDRSPPWIKLYNELLDDYEFGRLQDASKVHLVLIWLLASRSNNKLPYDRDWIGKRINATQEVDIDALIEAGFIVKIQQLQEAEQNASAMLAECLPRGRGETETEERESGASGADADKPTRKKPVRPFPEDFALDEEMAAYSRKHLPAIRPQTIFENFKNHHLAKGSQFADWRAAFRTWVGNEVKWKK